MSLLSVDDLSIQAGPDGPRIVRDLSFDISAGKMLALVGASGSGKTMVARSVLGLMPPPMLVTGGRIRFEGTDLTTPASPPCPVSRQPHRHDFSGTDDLAQSGAVDWTAAGGSASAASAPRQG
jgi:ABC-type glutathione transport system ATPase component